MLKWKLHFVNVTAVTDNRTIHRLQLPTTGGWNCKYNGGEESGILVYSRMKKKLPYFLHVYDYNSFFNSQIRITTSPENLQTWKWKQELANLRSWCFGEFCWEVGFFAGWGGGAPCKRGGGAGSCEVRFCGEFWSGPWAGLADGPVEMKWRWRSLREVETEESVGDDGIVGQG